MTAFWWRQESKMGIRDCIVWHTKHYTQWQLHGSATLSVTVAEVGCNRSIAAFYPYWTSLRTEHQRIPTAQFHPCRGRHILGITCWHDISALEAPHQFWLHDVLRRMSNIGCKPFWSSIKFCYLASVTCSWGSLKPVLAHWNQQQDAHWWLLQYAMFAWAVPTWWCNVQCKRMNTREHTHTRLLSVSTLVQ